MLVDESNGLRIIAVSTNTEKIFGRPHQEILGTSLLTHFVERQRIETALTMRELSLANPVTLGVAKLSDDDVRGTVNLVLHRYPRFSCGADGPVYPPSHSSQCTRLVPHRPQPGFRHGRLFTAERCGPQQAIARSESSLRPSSTWIPRAIVHPDHRRAHAILPARITAAPPGPSGPAQPAG